MKTSQTTCFNLLLWALAGLVAVAASVEAASTGSGSRVRREASPGEPKKSKKQASKDNSFRKECVSAHNNWRRMHGAIELKMDPELSEYAQARADYIAASDGDKFEHIRDNPYGENLAMHGDSSSSCTKLAKMWYDEVSLYDFSRPGFDLSTGHFTQMVWRGTRRVGCARQFSSGPRGGVYLVCVYDPPGNFQGEYQDNVLPAQSTKSAAPARAPAAPATGSTTEMSVGRQAAEGPGSGLKPSVSSLDNANSSSSSTTAKPKPKRKSKKNKKRKSGNKKNKKQQSNSTTAAPTTTRPALNSAPPA